jgi:site-specific recombinase XerD
VPTTLSGLISVWQQSPEWAAFAPKTQSRRKLMLDKIERRWINLTLKNLDHASMAEHVLAWRKELYPKRRLADEMISVLRRLIRFARRHGWLSRDVTEGIKPFGARKREEVFWADSDIDAFVREAIADGKPQVGDAVRLIAWTGLGLDDALALRWDQILPVSVVKPNSIDRKRTQLARLPGFDAFLAEVAGRPRRSGIDTVLVDDRGKPWVRSTFAKWVKIYRERAGIWHIDEETGEKRAKHYNDLRKTYARRLLSMGASEEEVAEQMNWRGRAVKALRTADEMRNGQ